MGNSVSERVWSDILAAVRSDRPELYRPWFASLAPVNIEHGVIDIATADDGYYQYLSQQCQATFSQAAQNVTGRLITVKFLPAPEKPTQEQPLSFEEESEQLVLNKDYTFSNFVVGPSNQLAHAACQAVGDNPGHVYNPLFIHGDVGLGKTHLLQAACHRILEQRPDARILYLTCEVFTNHFVEAIERGALHQFRYRYRHVDALVIDDIQFLAARERSREEFFHTFNTLYQSQKQIILSADEPPRGIPSLEDRLISRFNWGLVVRIDPPCLETRMAIVRKKARMRCADVPEDVIHFIATTAESNTRELEGALTKILATSQQYGGHINMAIARQALGDHVATVVSPISIADIVAVVVERYNVRLADLQGKRRNRSLAFPRQLCMYLARELTALSLEEIGGYFGGRDHTTVLHAVRTIQQQKEQDAEQEAAIQTMIETLRQAKG